MYRDAQTTLGIVIANLRQRLPTGAPVVLLPSVRANDWSELQRGVVLPMGLVSSKLCTEWKGEFINDLRPTLHVISGVLDQRHISALLPAMEEAARSGGSLVLAAEDFDPEITAMLLVNHLKATVRVLGVVPVPGKSGGVLEHLARLCAARLGHAGESLDIGHPGTVPSFIASLDRFVLLGEFGPETTPVGVVHVGGRDLHDSRTRIREVSQSQLS